MKIIVADRPTIERGLVVRSSYIVISITDPHKPDAKIPKTSGCRAVLRLKFDDAEPTSGFSPSAGLRLFGEMECTQVASFIDEYREQVGAVVVHCEAGMSRSPAVAAAVAKWLGGDSAIFFQNYAPNQFVYDLLTEHLQRRQTSDHRATEDSSS